MKTFMKTYLSFCILMLFSIQVFGQSFTNPIYNQADPYINFYNGYYYATGTAGANISIKKSATLEGLKSAKSIVVFGPSYGGPCCDYWASEIHRIDGKWYIYYTANEIGSNTGQRMYVIENTAADPTTGTWVNRGRIFDSGADIWAIDATILQLNGSNYIIYSGVANASDGDKPQRLYIARLSNPWTMATGRVLLKSPEFSWEQNGAVIEGPEVITKNGKVFLVYSANGCWTPDYLLGMMSIDQAADPLNSAAWYKYPNPVFVSNASVDAYAPGHHCFFTSPDGTEDWFAYHATSQSGGGCNNERTPRAQKISWNSDGTPNFGTPLATGIRITAPSGEEQIATASPVANGTYKIVIRGTGKLLDIANNSALMGANVQQWDDTGVEGQQWNIQATTEGYYYITSVRSGLTLDIENCSQDNAANVRMWSPNAANCQQWSIIDLGDGYFRIISRNSNKALDVNVSTNNLQQYDYLGGTNQQFQLVQVSAAVSPPDGYTVWASSNIRGAYIRHLDGRGQIDNNIVSVSDAYWKMVPGLAGTGVSFQSYTNPNAYLRHRNGEVWLDVDDGSQLYKNDATFNMVAGLDNASKVSFQSYNFPNSYIRHREGLLYSGAISTETDRKDATFSQIGSGISSVPVSGVTISPTNIILDQGQTQQLVVNISPTNASNKTVTWSSSNPNVLSVSTAGMVTAIAAGSASITVTTSDGGFIAYCTATVNGSSECNDITELGGSISSQYSDSPSGEGIENLIDNNDNTKYLTFNASAWIQYQAIGSFLVTEYSLTSANDAVERDPMNWTLQGSNDGLNWTTVDSRSGIDFPNRFQKLDFSFSNTTAYSYFRFNLNNNSGTILQLAEIELCGTAVTGNFSTLIEAESYSSMAGVDVETCSEGGQNVGWIDAGDWMVWDVELPTTDTYTVEYRVASPDGGGSIQLEKAGGSPVYGNISIPATGGWQNWQTISHSVNLEAGQQQLAIYVPVGAYNINWIQIIQGLKSADENISNSKDLSSINIYPIPAKNTLYINGIQNEAIVSVYDINGRQVQSELVYDNGLNIQKLNPGLYFLRIAEDDIQIIKFIKN